MNYRLSPRAAADLLSIFAHGIESFGEARALRTREELRGAFLTLAELPGMGTDRPELGEDIRSFPKGPHVVLYRPARDGVLIVRVRDARENWLPT